MENAFGGRHSRALAAGKAPPNPSSCWDSCKSPCLFPIALQGPDMAWQRLLTSDWLSSLLHASGVKPSLSYTSGSSIPEPLEEFSNPGPARETATSSGWGTGESWGPPELGHQQDLTPHCLLSPTCFCSVGGAWNGLAFLKIKGTPQSQGKAVTA